MNDCQRKELKSSVKEVVSKCILASNIVNLPISKVTPEELYNGIMDFVFYMKGKTTKENTLSHKYKEFKNLYPKIIPETRKTIIKLKKKNILKK